MGQYKMHKAQIQFNRYLLLATTTIALIGFYQISNTFLQYLGLNNWIFPVSSIVGFLILTIIMKLIYLIFKKNII